MSIEKPSHAEDEYFHKQELEQRQRLRQQLDQERELAKKAQAKNVHWMHCPKCGGQMVEELFRQVMVDHCSTCGYVGFDAGELDLIIGSATPSLARFASDLRNYFKFGNKK